MACNMFPWSDNILNLLFNYNVWLKESALSNNTLLNINLYEWYDKLVKIIESVLKFTKFAHGLSTKLRVYTNLQYI